MKISWIIPRIAFLLSFLLLLVFLWWHLRLGMTRYFDVDELAHLHWTSLILQGYRPYIDFLSFFTPGFWWFLAPFMKMGWGTTSVLVTSRIVMFGVFIGLCSASAFILWELRGKSWTVITAPLILAFLPMPFDKFLEIRPDLLATFFAMLGLLYELRFLRSAKTREGFWAGIWFSLSVVVLTKGAPGVAFALGIALLAMRRKALPMMLGFFVPIGLFLVWIFTLGDFSLVYYSLTRLPIEANRIGQTFFMSPDLFFYPNQIFYGQGGYSQGLIVNHVLWFIGIGLGTYRLFAPFNREGKKGAWRELLVAGTFIVQIVLYVLYFPLKHTQYLIPVAIFVAIYVADFVGSFWENVRMKRGPSIGFLLVCIVVQIFFYQTFLLVNQPKLAWTNKEMLDELDAIYKIVPAGAYIFDPEGPILFRRDPYYVCCLPFGQFSQYLTRPLPSFAQRLEKTDTQYIYTGHLDRLSMLSPDDQSYINAHYEASAQTDVLLVKIQ